jgi:hypothetical protein
MKETDSLITRPESQETQRRYFALQTNMGSSPHKNLQIDFGGHKLNNKSPFPWRELVRK